MIYERSDHVLKAHVPPCANVESEVAPAKFDPDMHVF